MTLIQVETDQYFLITTYTAMSGICFKADISVKHTELFSDNLD